MWAKLLSLATSGGTGAGAGAGAVAPTATADSGNKNGVFPCSPIKSVTFNGGDSSSSSSGTAPYLRPDSKAFEGFSRDDNNNNTASDMRPAAAPFPRSTDNPSDDWSGPPSSVVFARLWAECIGDDTCAAFASDDSCSTPGGTDGKTRTHDGPETPSPRHQHAPPPLSTSHRHLGPWERLVAVLRNEQGIDVSRALTTHEQILLEREVADWLQRVEGRNGQGLGQGKGMAERLASAAAAVLGQKEAVPTAAPERPHDIRAGETTAMAAGASPAAAEGSHNNISSGGIPNNSRRRLSVGGFEFPAVVVEGYYPPETATERAGSRGPSATAGDAGKGAGTAMSGSKKKPGRQLDLRGVALDAHEVCAFLL